MEEVELALSISRKDETGCLFRDLGCDFVVAADLFGRRLRVEGSVASPNSASSDFVAVADLFECRLRVEASVVFPINTGSDFTVVADLFERRFRFEGSVTSASSPSFGTNADCRVDRVSRNDFRASSDRCFVLLASTPRVVAPFRRCGTVRVDFSLLSASATNRAASPPPVEAETVFVRSERRLATAFDLSRRHIRFVNEHATSSIEDPSQF